MEINLAPPGKLRPPAEGEFDASPTALREWSLTFNVNNTGEATRAIYKVLRVTNGLEIPTAARLELLERSGTMLATILPKLQQNFSDGVYPLSKRNATIAELAIELQVAMLTGYRLVLQASSQDSSWLKRLGQQKNWVTSAHRLFYFFGDLMRTSQLLHRPYPRGMWHELHGLFKAAHESGRTGEKVVLCDASGRSTTLEHEYKRILLIALLPPHRFTPAQLKEVCSSMDYWVGQTRLLNTWRERDTARLNILVNQGGDSPPLILPRAPSPDESEDEWLLSTVTLNKQLRQLIEQCIAEPQRTVLVDKRVKVAEQTLRRLHQQWCNPPLRRDERRPGDGTVTVAIGISAIHEGMALKEEAIRKAEEAKRQSEEEKIRELELEKEQESVDTGPTLFDFGIDIDDNDEPDAYWDPLVSFEMKRVGAEQDDKAEKGRASSTGDKAQGKQEPVHYMPVEAGVVNFSKRGYRLSLHPDERMRLKVGELIGLEQAHSGRYQVGAIRWLQEENGKSGETEEHVLLGVRLLLHNVFPAQLLIRHKGSQSAPQPCLIGVAGREFSSLVVPALPGLNSKQLSIKLSDKETLIQLDKQAASTAQFEVWQISAKVRSTQLNVKGLTLEKVREILSGEQEQAKPAHDSNKPREEGEGFGSLWDSL